MQFVPGKLYRIKQTYTLFSSYVPATLHKIESGEILLFLDYFEYRNDITIFVKRFLIDNKFVMDDIDTLDNPEKYFEPVEHEDI